MLQRFCQSFGQDPQIWITVKLPQEFYLEIWTVDKKFAFASRVK